MSILSGPFSRKSPEVNTLMGPSQLVVDEATSNGRMVEYTTDSGERVSFLFCQAGRIEKFVDDVWEHGATSLTYTTSEGAFRDCFGYCGVPKLETVEELKKLFKDIAALFDAAGVKHNLAVYASISDEWWTPDDLKERKPRAVASPRASPQRHLPPGKLDHLYKDLISEQAEMDAERELNFAKYKHDEKVATTA
eukprot:Hpha_TRINITY_DN11471_c0_g1::TRINITY_DN11471_c0_g1_i2::g.137458::m.137458